MADDFMAGRHYGVGHFRIARKRGCNRKHADLDVALRKKPR